MEGERVMLRVRAEAVAFGVDAAHELRVLFGARADDEEGRARAVRGEDVEHLGGEGRVGTIVEREGDGARSAGGAGDDRDPKLAGRVRDRVREKPDGVDE